jgi:hypothetical protein
MVRTKMLCFSKIRRTAVAALALLFWLAPIAAQAAVEITFYSHESRENFPHAFIRLTGSLDATGERIEANYGFTATRVSPAILLGSVRGDVMSSEPPYVSASDRHFSVTLTDAEYAAVMTGVQRWRDLPQPSYSLNRQNCVFFVGYIASALGMRAETPARLMKKPRSYTDFLVRSNRDWLQRRGATIHTEPR